MALTLAAVGGCSSAVPIRSPGVVVGASGNRSELVFASTQVQALEPVESAEVRGRLDGVLVARGPETVWDQAFPSPAAPSLDRARRVYLYTRTPEQFLYFQRRSVDSAPEPRTYCGW